MASQYPKYSSKVESKSSKKNELSTDPSDIEVVDDSVSDEIELNKKESSSIRTVAAKERAHQKLLNDVDAFLANGGQIHQVSSFDQTETPVRYVKQFNKNIM